MIYVWRACDGNLYLIENLEFEIGNELIISQCLYNKEFINRIMKQKCMINPGINSAAFRSNIGLQFMQKVVTIHYPETIRVF